MEKQQALLTMMDLDKDPKELATAEEAYAFFQRVSAIEKLVAGIREQTRLRMFKRQKYKRIQIILFFIRILAGKNKITKQ